MNILLEVIVRLNQALTDDDIRVILSTQKGSKADMVRFTKEELEEYVENEN